MTAPGTLLRDKLPAKIAAYFERNPGEELLYDDAAAKFGCRRKTLYRALATLKGAGKVEVVNVIRGKS